MFKVQLRRLRKSKGLSQYALAEQLGLSRGQLANYEQGSREPDYETLKVIANYFGVTVDFLIYADRPVSTGQERLATLAQAGHEKSALPLEDVRTINVYRLNPANKDDIFAEENVIGSQLVPADSINMKSFKVIDNSMSGSHILPGATVLIEEDDNVANEEIVVAQVPGHNELLIRRYTITNDEVTLSPDNSSYEKLTLPAKDVRIIGVVTGFNTHIGRKPK